MTPRPNKRAAVDPVPGPAREPGSVSPPVAEPGTPSSRTANPDERRTGTATPGGRPGVASQSPAGGAVDADAALSAGQALRGAEWRKAAKAEQSRQGREGRRRAHRYVPVAKRTGYRPGMARREPPEPPRGAA